MWPGLDRKALPAGGRGLVAAALCAGLLAACEEESVMSAAGAEGAGAEGAGAAAFLDIDLESFEAGWDCAGTYPRGELVNRLNGYRLYRIGRIDYPAYPTVMWTLFAVEGSRPGCRFLVTAEQSEVLELPKAAEDPDSWEFVPDSPGLPFVSLIADMIRDSCGGWEHDVPAPSRSVRACSRAAERDILRRTAQFSWNYPRHKDIIDFFVKELLFLDGEVIFRDGRRM
jgi:hypothetical protein